jgi:hypothetical protein
MAPKQIAVGTPRGDGEYATDRPHLCRREAAGVGDQPGALDRLHVIEVDGGRVFQPFLGATITSLGAP